MVSAAIICCVCGGAFRKTSPLGRQPKYCSSKCKWSHYNSLHPEKYRRRGLARRAANPMRYIGDNLSTSKVCTHCQTEKPLSEFAPGKHVHTKLRQGRGVQAKCRSCKKRLDADRWAAKAMRLGLPRRNFTADGKRNTKRCALLITFESAEQRHCRLADQRAYLAEGAATLSDVFIAKRLRLPVAVAEPIIPAKRSLLKIHRLLKEMNK